MIIYPFSISHHRCKPKKHTIRAPSDGIIGKINYKVGDFVEEKKVLATLDTK